MKKKIVSLLLAGALATSLLACGGSSESTESAGSSDSKTTEAADSTEAAKADGEKLVVWTLAVDLEDFAAKYTEETGTPVEVTVIAPEEYPTKVQTALLAGEVEPDIIVAEPQMLDDMYDLGFFADLDALGAKDYEGQIVDYVWEKGKSADGVQRAISYQITPAGFYYRSDIAIEVFGTDDPAEIGKLFADYKTILETGKKLQEKGYKIFASDAEVNYFSGQSAWVVDGKLNLDQARQDYMDLCVELYQSDMTAYASQWAAPWYMAMNGPVPLLTAETQWGNDDLNVWDAESFKEATADYETAEVFAFGLPTWGSVTMEPHTTDTAGKWKICSGPDYGFGGGTYIGISSYSERQELAWDFVKFCTLTESTLEWWVAEKADVVSLKSVLEAHKDDEVEKYGGQKTYAFWLEQAEGIDLSKVTRYDKAIGDAWGNAISKVKTGELSKEDAISAFYDEVESTYPDIVVER